MPISKASSSAVAPGAKGDLVVGNATNDSGILAVGANNQVLTADSSTATGLKWAAAGGAIKSVNFGTRTTGFSTTSASYVDVTGMTVTVTPQSISSKFIILLSTQFNVKNSSLFGSGKVLRDATSILSWQQGISTSSTQNKISWATTYVDQPATTSAITYKFQILSGESGKTIELEEQASIIVLEI